MSVQLLDKTRKINKLLHNNNSSKVVFNDICKALSEISDEWKWIVDNLFVPKCEQYGYCTEKKSCGRKDRKN